MKKKKVDKGKMKLRKIFSYCLVLLTVFFVGAQAISAAEGNLAFTKDEVLNSQQLIDGVKWEKYKGVSTHDDGSKGNQVVNFASIAPGAAQIIGWGIPSATGIKPSTVLEAAAHYEKTHPDMQVIAAINNDYFGSDSSTGIFSMRNTSVIDGVVYREKSMYSQMYGIGVDNNGQFKLTAPGGQLEISDNYFLDIYDASGTYVIKTIELAGFNTTIGDGETAVIYKTAVTADGFEIFELATTSASKIDTTFYIAGKSKGNVSATTASSVAIATKDLEVANLIDSGANVRVYKTLAGEWAEYSSIIGCPAQTLKDGVIQTVEEIKDYGYDHVNDRHPRTAIGFKADGTVYIMVIDGRQAEKGMDGVSERENALALKQEGCVAAFNFDGGGSSTFAVLIDGELTVTNSPSDGSLRSDANHLLVVAPRAKVNYETEQTVLSNGLVSVKGSATIEGLNGNEFKNSTILVNGVATNQSIEDFSLELLPNKEYKLSIKTTCTYGGKSSTKVIGEQLIKTEGETKEMVAPNKFDFGFELSNLGFVVQIKVSDPHNVITSVNVSYNNKTVAATRNSEGFFINVMSKEAKDYEFTVSYTYRLAIGQEQEVTLDPVNYTYGQEMPEHEHVECPECGLCTDADCDGKESDKCQGHDEEHVHVECPECGKCIADECNGKESEKCQGHKATDGTTGNSGMNCNFGGLLVSSFIASFALLVIVLKRK
ncbi:MAG: phosphodiester glycosidase family protein [Bacilli bacterium]|nr:phosphodiester glycosidase family protein [Bacilli bacterium]